MAHSENDRQKECNISTDSIHAAKKPFKRVLSTLLLLSDIFILLTALLFIIAGIGIFASFLCGGYDPLSHCPPIITVMTMWTAIAACVSLLIGVLLKVICHFISKKEAM